VSGSVLALLAHNSAALSIAYFAVGVAGHRSPRRLAWATAAAAVAVLALPLLRGEFKTAAGLVASVVVAYLIGINTRQHRVGQERAELLLAEAQVALEEKARAAALAERARIAREIHDVLAHSLSALTVHLEGARVALRGADVPPVAVTQVERARRLAREGLEETRRAVQALRGDPLPLPDLLAGLAALYRADHGAPAAVTVHGTPRPLGPDVALAGYRVAQEAVTNVGRHSPGAPVAIRLAYDPGEVRLEVRNGPARDEPQPGGGGGYGLTGMRKRAALLGGTLDAGPEEGGWRVRLALPG